MAWEKKMKEVKFLLNGVNNTKFALCIHGSNTTKKVCTLGKVLKNRPEFR